MIVIEHCNTASQTRDGICDFLKSEADRYRRDSTRTSKSYARAQEMARCNALLLAVSLLEDALLRQDASPAPL